jgi:hypothetical protein
MAITEQLGLNFTAARGSGDDLSSNANEIGQMITALDVDPHYTFLYEYKVPTAALNMVSGKPSTDNLNTGFANTTALSAGVSVPVTKSLTVSADFWFLQATEKVETGALDAASNPILSDDIGMEVDVKIGWKIADNLAWNWNLGLMKPGDVYASNTGVAGINVDADDITGIQGILAYKF